MKKILLTMSVLLSTSAFAASTVEILDAVRDRHAAGNIVWGTAIQDRHAAGTVVWGTAIRDRHAAGVATSASAQPVLTGVSQAPLLDLNEK